MKINRVKNTVLLFAAFIAILSLSITGCKKDKEEEPQPDPVPAEIQKTTYAMKVKDVVGVSGTITIAEKSPGSSESVVSIHLDGAPLGMHPAHIHMNSALETGAILYGLNDVDTLGNSSTTLAVSYAILVSLDGYVNVHLSNLLLGTIIAQADIGGNALTGANKSYLILADSSSGITGNVKFEKRKNGTSLVTVDMASGGTLPAGLYPTHINLGSVATIGSPVNRRTLNPVDGITRKSITNVRTLNDGSAISYENWLVYDGFITVYDAANNSNILALGNIGSN